jgi:ABC-2 type transport system ATP-binding protein
MIEAEKLTKRYRPVTAVDGLTVTARPGHVPGFLGPNGAGGAVAIGVIAAAGRRPRRLSPGR